MPRITGWFLFLALLAALAVPVAAQQTGQPPAPGGSIKPQVFFDVSASFSQKIPIAVRDLETITPGGPGSADVSQGLAQRLRDNLDLTGYFVSLDRRSFLETNSRAGISPDTRVNFQEWLAVGAEYLVKGGYSLNGSQLVMELRLFKITDGSMPLGKRYTGTLADGRSMINRFTNEILYLITGEYGVFGTQIVFVGGSKAGKRVFLTEFGSDEAKQVSSSTGPAFMPAISASGTVAYVAREGQNYQLKVGNAVVSSGDLHLAPAFTPSGEILVSISGPSTTNIFRIPPGGGRPQQVTDAGGINISPSVSPDGGRMAFVSDRGGSAQIYISSISGGPATRLTASGGQNLDPAWSPKGDLIAFCREGKDIFVINPDGSGARQLTSGGGNTHPSFSPDGRLIVFASTRSGKEQLYVMTVTGDMQRPLMPDYPGNQYHPCWSPAPAQGAPAR